MFFFSFLLLGDFQLLCITIPYHSLLYNPIIISYHPTAIVCDRHKVPGKSALFPFIYIYIIYIYNIYIYIIRPIIYELWKIPWKSHGIPWTFAPKKLKHPTSSRQCGSSLLLQRADPRKFLDASVGTAS